VGWPGEGVAELNYNSKFNLIKINFENSHYY